MYYDSSMGVDKDIQELMSRGTELDVDNIPRDMSRGTELDVDNIPRDIPRGAGVGTATLSDLTKDCLDGKEKTE